PCLAPKVRTDAVADKTRQKTNILSISHSPGNTSYSNKSHSSQSFCGAPVVHSNSAVDVICMVLSAVRLNDGKHVFVHLLTFVGPTTREAIFVESGTLLAQISAPLRIADS
ncbi:hypothetical protein X801_03226, partial [Opisthorchis viverrini]